MNTCVACQKPLTILIKPPDDDGYQNMGGSSAGADTYVDDDVQLNCGCRFHWQCLLDAYSMTECPNCGTNLVTVASSGEQRLLCNVKNEGGLQEGLDILPILTEESYLKAYPEERKCRAFLEFCAEGDIEAIVDLLEDAEEDGHAGDPSTERNIDVLRYQDQIGNMDSGLHVAIQNKRFEVAWLLLFLASRLEVGQFPTDVLQAAQSFELRREDQSLKTDIRLLKDAEGNTAEQRAASIGGAWNEWVQAGRLRPPQA